MHPPRKRSQGGGMLGMAGGTIHQLLNGAIIRQRGQVREKGREGEMGRVRERQGESD